VVFWSLATCNVVSLNKSYTMQLRACVEYMDQLWPVNNVPLQFYLSHTGHAFYSGMNWQHKREFQYSYQCGCLCPRQCTQSVCFKHLTNALITIFICNSPLHKVYVCYLGISQYNLTTTVSSSPTDSACILYARSRLQYTMPYLQCLGEW